MIRTNISLDMKQNALPELVDEHVAVAADDNEYTGSIVTSQALVVETLHSVGLCLLVFYVLPSFDPLIGCFLLLNVGFFPGLIKVRAGAGSDS